MGGRIREDRHLPLMLTALAPGLGHLLGGAVGRGVLYLALTLGILALFLIPMVNFFLAAILQDGDMAPAAWQAAAIFLYGLIFTGLVMLDAADLKPKGESQALKRRYPLAVLVTYALLVWWLAG